MVIVTGASTGIGHSIAHHLAENNIQVLATYRSEKDKASLTHSNITPFQLDVTHEQDRKKFKDYIDAHQLKITALINNAGLVGAGPLEFYPLEEFKKIFEVNVWGLYAMTQLCLPYLRLTRGKVINMSSLSGLTVTPFLGPYNASKFAVEVITDATRMEMQETAVQFVLIEPGSIKTPIWDKSKNEWDRVLASLPPQALEYYQKNLTSFAKLVKLSGENGLPALEVAALTLKILQAEKPKHRYLIGKGARIPVLMSFLPSKWLDKILWSYINKY